jgi:hypothetical protein
MLHALKVAKAVVVEYCCDELLSVAALDIVIYYSSSVEIPH